MSTMSLVLSDLAVGVRPLAHLYLNVVCLCRRPLRLNKFNFASEGNEIVTNVTFYSWPCFHGN